MDDGDFMNAALALAREAYAAGEVPVGAVIVRDGAIIASARNETRAARNPLLHAEAIAIARACESVGNERLTDCDLFVTKEPCAMCAGAIVNARVRRVVIAARDVRYGACGTVLCVCGNRSLNHVPVIEFGLAEEEAAALLKDFFKERREG